MPFPPVPCLISKPGQESNLTMESGDDGANIIIIPPTGNPGEQEWIIEHRSDNTVTVRNLKHDGKYLGVKGDVSSNPPVVASSDPLVFTSEPGDGPHSYRLYVEKDGEKYYLEFSMLRIYPPQTSLLSSRLVMEPWNFQFLD